MSLGIDPISRPEKICNFDCVYCQLGKTDILTNERKVYVPAEEILKEICALPPTKLDYLTFSGRGEPTLAKNLGEMILALRPIKLAKIAVITNSLLMDQVDVRLDLALADFVLAKLDACSPETLACVHKPLQAQHFSQMIAGLKEFRRIFKGRLALQLMFIDANKDRARDMAAVAREINADEVELNTPLRPSGAAPLTEAQLEDIKKEFIGLPAKTVYEAERKSFRPLNDQDTVRRHGQWKDR
jgi:wyosine [tRNA(Phe)-imidazoG37] synthetase (radical SAM superfamily)